MDISDKKAYKMAGRHWICGYYDGELIHIYDSLNNSNLNDQIILFIHLFILIQQYYILITEMTLNTIYVDNYYETLSEFLLHFLFYNI